MAEGNGSTGQERGSTAGRAEGGDSDQHDTRAAKRRGVGRRLLRKSARTAAALSLVAGLNAAGTTPHEAETAAQISISGSRVPGDRSGDHASSQPESGPSKADHVREKLEKEAAARQQEELAEEAQFKEAFGEYAIRVRKDQNDPEHISIEQAAKGLDLPPEVFALFLTIDSNLTTYHNTHDAGEREAIKNGIVEFCSQDNTRLSGDELEAFIHKMRPDITENEVSDIVASMRVKEATLKEIPDDKKPAYERAAVESELKEANEAGKKMKETLAQKAAGLVVDKVLDPLQDWIVAKQHKLEHWMKVPKEEWLKRGAKLLWTLLKYTFYLLLWMSSTINKASGRSGGGRGH
jgi:hypothetical protein